MFPADPVGTFSQRFLWHGIDFLRGVFRDLFVQRLRLEKPDLVVLSLAAATGGRSLRLAWRRRIIDAVVCQRTRHSDYGNELTAMIRRAVRVIRAQVRADVPIVVRLDRGVFDEQIPLLCEVLNIGYVCSGRLHDEIGTWLRDHSEGAWPMLERKPRPWRVFDLAYPRRASGRRRRATFWRPMYTNRRRCLKCGSPATMVYTNLSHEQRIDVLLRGAGCADRLIPRWIG